MIKKKILIVGAGPVGILLGLALDKLGHSVIILEHQSQSIHNKRADTTKLSRLYAIASGSYDIMKDDVGVSFNKKHFQPINRIYINDGGAETSFDPNDIGAENFGYMIEESDLFSQLLDELANSSIDLRYGVGEIKIAEEEHGISLVTSDQEYTADLILASDGRNSMFRNNLPFETMSHSYNESAMVFTIQHPKFNHNGLAVETFLPSGPFAVLPHRDPHHSAIVWSAGTEMAEAFIKMDNNEKHSIIADRLLDCYGKFSFESEFISYPLNLILPDSLFYKNVLLIGDSSHVVHPIAGQGFNLGIRDIKAFLSYIKELHLYNDQSHMLECYQEERLSDIRKLANSTDFISSLFSNNNCLLKCARKVGLTFFDAFDKTKMGVMRYAAGQDND